MACVGPVPLSRSHSRSCGSGWDCFLAWSWLCVSFLGPDDRVCVCACIRMCVRACVHPLVVSCCHQGCVWQCPLHTAGKGNPLLSIPSSSEPRSDGVTQGEGLLAPSQPHPEGLLLERAPGSHWGSMGN